jgi:hypothetical protein
MIKINKKLPPVLKKKFAKLNIFQISQKLRTLSQNRNKKLIDCKKMIIVKKNKNFRTANLLEFLRFFANLQTKNSFSLQFSQ